MEREDIVATMYWLVKKPAEERTQLVRTVIEMYMAQNKKKVEEVEATVAEILTSPTVFLGEIAPKTEDEAHFFSFFITCLKVKKASEEAA